jgi:hypothetical protein
MSQRLFEAAPGPKHLHMIEGANHGNWNGAGLEEYRRVVREFVTAARARMMQKLRPSAPAPAAS